MFKLFQPSKPNNVKAISDNEVDSALEHVFFVTSWGYGADHWFSWFAKALNSHPEIFAYLANEGSRPKYFPEERSRAQRPNLPKFARFLADVGMTYQAIGDCYSYRPTMMQPLFDAFGDKIPVIHLTRHPYPWLDFHVKWRMFNMRMLGGENSPIDHEWKNGCDHKLFKRLNLKPYQKSDIEIWTTYQGFWKMNDAAADLQTGIKHFRLEDVVSNTEIFNQAIALLTKNRISFSADQKNLIDSWVWEPFRGEDPRHLVPAELKSKWPDWKHEAMEKILSSEAKNAFTSLGYKL